MSSEHEPEATPRRATPAADDDPLVGPRESGGSGLIDSSPPAEGLPAPVVPEPGGAETSPVEEEPHRRQRSANMLPQREGRRTGLERFIVRLIATFGIVAIGVAIGAIMVSSHSLGWIVGLVVSGVTVVLAGLLWSSRML